MQELMAHFFVGGLIAAFIWGSLSGLHHAGDVVNARYGKDTSERFAAVCILPAFIVFCWALFHVISSGKFDMLVPGVIAAFYTCRFASRLFRAHGV